MPNTGETIVPETNDTDLPIKLGEAEEKVLLTEMLTRAEAAVTAVQNAFVEAHNTYIREVQAVELASAPLPQRYQNAIISIFVTGMAKLEADMKKAYGR